MNGIILKIHTYSSKFSQESNEYRTYSVPMYLEKNIPHSQRIRFVDSKVHEKIRKYLKSNDEASLLAQCAWEATKYDLVFEVIDNNKCKHQQPVYTIELTEKDVKCLRENVRIMLKNYKKIENNEGLDKQFWQISADKTLSDSDKNMKIIELRSSYEEFDKYEDFVVSKMEER